MRNGQAAHDEQMPSAPSEVDDLTSRIRPLTKSQNYSIIQTTGDSLLNRHMLHFYSGVYTVAEGWEERTFQSDETP